MLELDRKAYQTSAEIVGECTHTLPHDQAGAGRSVSASAKITFFEDSLAHITLEATTSGDNAKGEFTEYTYEITGQFDPEQLLALQEAFSAAVRQGMAENGPHKDVGRKFAIAG